LKSKGGVRTGRGPPFFSCGDHEAAEDDEELTPAARAATARLSEASAKLKAHSKKEEKAQKQAREKMPEWAKVDVHQAAMDDDLPALKLVAQNHSEMLSKADDSSFAPLHWAAINGHERAIGFLLKQGVPINQTTSSGYTALHLAQGKQVKLRLQEAGAGVLTDAQVKQLQYNAGVAKRHFNTGAAMPQWHTAQETDAPGGWFKKRAPPETPTQTDAQSV